MFIRIFFFITQEISNEKACFRYLFSHKNTFSKNLIMNKVPIKNIGSIFDIFSEIGLELVQRQCQI